jgi:hypothetical protein
MQYPSFSCRQGERGCCQRPEHTQYVRLRLTLCGIGATAIPILEAGIEPQDLIA